MIRLCNYQLALAAMPHSSPRGSFAPRHTAGQIPSAAPRTRGHLWFESLQDRDKQAALGRRGEVKALTDDA